MTVTAKFGFQKGLTANPVEGWLQLHPNLAAYHHMLLSSDFPAPADLIIGMDALCSFARSDIIINGLEKQILVIEDKE